MAESEDESSLLAMKEFDVTNCCLRVCSFGYGSRILVLEPEEAILTSKTLCQETVKRMPYGELGNVEKINECGCLHSFKSNLSPEGSEGEHAPISPGCGCEQALVDGIVDELKSRMKGRGDTGNIQRAEDAIHLMFNLAHKTTHSDAKIDLILRQMQIPEPAMSSEVLGGPDISAAFLHMEWNTTGCCLATCCCGKQTLLLDPEEADKRMPYGGLGEVTLSEQVCGCVSVSSSLGMLSPGWGCNKKLVTDIAEEMKMRMKARGDTGNIQRQEQTIKMIHKVAERLARQEGKIDAIMKQMGIPVPAPKQEAMK